jgi:phosphatidylglycerol---prolipoprotein diacylglyceryl transferase
MTMLLYFIHWNFKPEIFNIGHYGPRWYGVLFALAFVFGYYLMLRIFKKEGIKPEVLDSLTMYMFFGTLIGARLGHCFFYEPMDYIREPWRILMVWEGGLASHGAGIGILIALYLFSRKHKKTFLWIMDRIVIMVALSGFLIRTGNFLNSEIVGKQTEVPWGVIFIRLHENFARHPSQLYEAFAYLSIFFLLLYLFHKTKAKDYPGLLFGLFLVTVFGFRFFIEFTKEIQVDFEAKLPLDMGQWLSIPFVLAGIVLLYLAYRKYNNRPKLV